MLYKHDAAHVSMSHKGVNLTIYYTGKNIISQIGENFKYINYYIEYFLVYERHFGTGCPEVP